MRIIHTTDENVAFYRADVTSSKSIRAAAIKIRAVLVSNGPLLEKSEARIRQVAIILIQRTRFYLEY